MRSTRRTLPLAVAALVAGALTMVGCAADEPASTPSPTQTAAFTTDDEAYAAAEKTYRAYIDAFNAIDYADPATFTAAYNLTTGKQHAIDKKGVSRFYTLGATSSGGATIDLLRPAETSADHSTTSLAVCLDVSQVTAHDADGNSLVGEDRPDVQTLVVTVRLAKHSPTKYLIDTIYHREDGPPCE